MCLLLHLSVEVPRGLLLRFKIAVLKSFSLIVPRPFLSYPFSHANTITGRVKTVNPPLFFLFFVILLRLSCSFLALPLQITSIYVFPSERAMFRYTHVKLQACRYILLCRDHCKTLYFCRVWSIEDNNNQNFV
jgi:hypothetical protein